MNPDSGKAAIPDLLLERYRLDEVSPAERAEVERALHDDPAVGHRLREIERSDHEIRDSGLTQLLAGHVRERAGANASRHLPAWAVPFALGATVLLLIVVGSRNGGLRPDAGDERVKGLHPSLTVFRQTPRGSETLADGAAAREGDVLRLAYQAAGQAYGVIVSIDGRGAVTVHLPEAGSEAAPLHAGDQVLLDHAYELDDAPQWECFYFVTARQPFKVQPVTEAAKRQAARHEASAPPALPLSRGLEQSIFVLTKERTP